MQGEYERYPIDTFYKQQKLRYPIKVPINAATSVAFQGELFLHGVLFNQFNDDSFAYHLKAGSRQFSNYLILIGNMNSPTEFAPKYASIVRFSLFAFFPSKIFY